jgi:hypothetical protein
MVKNRQTRSMVERDGGDAQSGNRSGRRILIVVVPPLRTLDLFGPLEVFSDAT